MTSRTTHFGSAVAATTLLASGAAVMSLAGCNDSDIEAQLAASRELRAQSAAFEKATYDTIGSATDDAAQAAQLASMADKTGKLGASAEQKAIASLLSSEMSRGAATLYVGDARDLEHQENSVRALIVIAADSAATLQSVADAQSKLSLGASREELTAAKADALKNLKIQQNRVKGLEDPVNQLKRSLEERRAKLAEMQKRADDLRREALAVDAIEAFPKVEQSADIKTSAAQLRASISRDDLELLTIQPELRLANESINAAQALAQASDAALQAIENYSASLQDDGGKLAKTADELRQQAEALLADLEKERDGALKDAYGNAQLQLERSLASAGRAANSTREMAAVAAQVKLDATVALAALAASHVAGIDAQIGLREQLAGAGALFGGEAKHKEAIDALKKEREEAFTAATEQYGKALEAVGLLNADSPLVTRTKAALDSSLATLEGRTVAPAKPAGAAASAPTVDASAVKLIPMGSGFASSDELAKSFIDGNSDLALAVSNFKRGFAYSQEQARAFVEFLTQTTEAVVPLLDAVTEKFGDAAGAQFAKGAAAGATGGGMGKYERLERNGASYLRLNAMRTMDFPIVEVNGAWYLNADGVLDGADATQRAMLGSNKAMLEKLGRAMREGIADIASKVRSGEISSIEMIGPALQAAMMKAISSTAPGR